MLASEITRVARSKGVDLVGFADVSIFPEAENKTWNPSYYLPDAKTVIVMGLKLNDALWDSLTGTYDVHSANLMSYLLHYNYDLLDFAAVQVARYIEELGYDAYPIQARTESKKEKVYIGYFPFKEAARLAGMGGIGKNTLLITPEFGPRARLVSVITDLEIEDSKRQVVDKTTEETCGDCSVCIDRCPVHALSYKDDVPMIDRRKCQGYMDVAQGCALCQGSCTKGREAATKRRAKKAKVK